MPPPKERRVQREFIGCTRWMQKETTSPKEWVCPRVLFRMGLVILRQATSISQWFPRTVFYYMSVLSWLQICSTSSLRNPGWTAYLFHFEHCWSLWQKHELALLPGSDVYHFTHFVNKEWITGYTWVQQAK